MSFDLDAALRWLKPSRRRRPLQRRPDEQLNWIDTVPAAGGAVLLDTTVYVDSLQGRSPDSLDAFLSVRTCNHSCVCLSELTHAFGRLNPNDRRTEKALKVIGRTVRNIPSYRLVAPDASSWGEAGILGGLLFRLGCHPAGAERKCLNDALVYLQGRKNGWPVVTRNLRDFDFLNQLVPDGRVLLYRRVEN
ncbi:MAG: type II toxin-antitoxin system VapC family toxin [Steroidobacteraceae bacterium]